MFSESESNTKHCGFKALNILMLSLKLISKWRGVLVAWLHELQPQGQVAMRGVHRCVSLCHCLPPTA